jgi:UDP-N-acetylglucosamine 1-carboxyvinyltransferase
VAAALSTAQTTILNVPDIADIHGLLAILSTIGLDISLRKSALTVQPRQPTVSTIPGALSSKLRGSVYALAILARFFPQGTIGEIGGDLLISRTLEPHARALAGFGVEMRQLECGWRLLGGPGRPGEFSLRDRRAGITATCLALLLGAALEGRSIIHEASDELEVQDMIDCVTSLGAFAFLDGTTLIVDGPMKNSGASWAIPGDQTCCGTMAIAVAITGGEATLPLGMANRMGSILDALEESGIQISREDKIIRIRGRAKKAVSITTAPFPGFPTDVGPQMAALLTQADGTSHFTETVNSQRFDHVYELRDLGAEIQLDGDRATIVGPRRLTAARIRGSGLRETSALVLASLAAHGTTVIEGGQALFRGFEDFPRDLATMGADVETIWEATGYRESPAHRAE